LEDLLQAFTQVEYLSGDNLYECDKCLTKVVATKQFKVSNSPNTLILHIKRFSGKCGKLDNFVKFSRQLSIENLTVSKGCGSDSYYIRAIVVHIGVTISSGHYVAYARIGSGRWIEFNDEKCTVVDWDYVRMQRAYLLFYDQVTS